MNGEFICVVVPTLNEEAHVERVVGSLLSAGDADMELIVADGGSTDATRAIVSRLGATDARVRLVDNPGRYQSAGVNIASRVADSRATVLVRCDAHCGYPEGFVRKVARVLRKTGATSVVVPMLTVGDETCFQSGVAAAQNSRLGNGGAAHRIRGAVSGWVDHGHHAGFDLSFFRSVGGYDESFAVNEDAEYDLRASKAGSRVWMSHECLVEYCPRSSPGALWRQYFVYGKGRCRTVLKHGVMPGPRQVLPVVAVAVSGSSLLVAPVFPWAILAPVVYVLACVVAGAVEGGRPVGGRCERTTMGAALAIMHTAWGSGFIYQLLAKRGRA